MERKPYQQRVIEDVDQFMSLFAPIGDPAKTFNSIGGAYTVAHGPVKVARVGLGDWVRRVSCG